MSKLKSAKEILDELGFNPDAEESTQLSLYRHLKRAAQNLQQPAPKTSEPVQLVFDLEGPKSGSCPSAAKKITSD